MKTRKICLGVLMVLVFSTCLSFKTAQAQVPDLSGWVGIFFGVTATRNGLEFPGLGVGSTSSSRESFQAMIEFTDWHSDANSSYLTGFLWIKTVAGNNMSWHRGDPHNFYYVAGTELDFTCWTTTTAQSPGIVGNWFGVMIRITGKLDRTQTVLNSATLSSSGGFAWSVDDAGISSGQLTLKGKLVDRAFCNRNGDLIPPCSSGP